MRSFRALIEANVRGWNPYWSWRDKPIRERNAAREILGRVCAWLTSSRENEDKTRPIAGSSLTDMATPQLMPVTGIIAILSGAFRIINCHWMGSPCVRRG